MLPTRQAEWPLIMERAMIVAANIPPEGLSLAAYERLALFDVDPAAVPASVAALRRKGAIWTRNQRGVVRVFNRRPKTIAGIFPRDRNLNRFLAGASPIMAQIADGVMARENAKARRDSLAAQEARDDLDASARQMVMLVVRHAPGVCLDDCRRVLWSTFHPSAMDFLAAFEPTLAANSTCKAILTGKATPPRVSANLGLSDRLVALIEKAGDMGATKASLCRGVRPPLPAVEIAAALADLTAQQRVATRSVRVVGSGRQGLRYFSRTLADAA